MEEYENLKRFPDQRAQRMQQQQQQMFSTPTIQLPQLQKMYLDLFRSMSSEEQQGLDYTKMIQTALELGLGQHFMDIQKPSKFNSAVPLNISLSIFFSYVRFKSISNYNYKYE